MSQDGFASYHPVVNFSYFIFVLVFTMIFMHPIFMVISFLAAFIYSLVLNGAKAWRFNLIYLLPILLVTALVNPVFNHRGATILTYFKSGNPLTLESIIYGFAAALLLITIILWFSCYNAVMTSDKFIYLFGKIIPALSLIITMALRFVPRFKAQLEVIANAQRCVGRDLSNGSLIQRGKHGLTILSIMVTWALENAIETADSMKSRGYGLPGRTAFSIFTFQPRDWQALIFVVAVGGYLLIGGAIGGLDFRYFPTIKGKFSFYTLTLALAHGAICFLPLGLEWVSSMKWKNREMVLARSVTQGRKSG